MRSSSSLRRPLVSLALICVGAAFSVQCDSSKSASGPNPVAATPAPTATPSATPTPTVTPEPGPAPSPIGPGVNCTAGPSSSTRCGTESAVYRLVLEIAQSDVRRTQPALFNGALVGDQDAYVRAVATAMRNRGYCTQAGPGDRVGVKTTNVGSEEYDIILGTGEPWAGYVRTCRPAHF